LPSDCHQLAIRRTVTYRDQIKRKRVKEEKRKREKGKNRKREKEKNGK